MIKYTKKALKVAFDAGKADGFSDATENTTFYLGECEIIDVTDEFRKEYSNGYRFWYEKTLKNGENK